MPNYLLLPVMLNSYNIVRPVWMDWLNKTRPELQEVYYDLLSAVRKSLPK